VSYIRVVRTEIVPPLIGANPTVDDQDSTWGDVRRETRDGGPQLSWIMHVADAAEETGDGVERLAKVQRAHIGLA
jgi:hypothetical protein